MAGRKQLDEGFDRNKWIPNFVCQTRTKKANRSELFGMLHMHRELRPLESALENRHQLHQLSYLWEMWIGRRDAATPTPTKTVTAVLSLQN